MKRSVIIYYDLSVVLIFRTWKAGHKKRRIFYIVKIDNN
jgi:hypothetical protein